MAPTTLLDTPTLVDDTFYQWAALGTPATRGLSLDDFNAEPYLDAVCFTLRGALNDDAYLVRANVVVHFGLDDDTLESAYQMTHHHSSSASRLVTRPRRL